MTEEVEEFLKRYEVATNSHNFDKVAPLLADNAVYWFSDDGFEGVTLIREAFEKTWRLIEDEVYGIVDVRWVWISSAAAACIYEFRWQGRVDGVQRSGNGRGTNVMVKSETGWQMVHEHLSKHPVQKGDGV